MKSICNAKVILLTGLSGSGKTTIANALQALYKNIGITPILLDGDILRNQMQQFGFDEASRKMFNIEVGKIAALKEMQGNIVIIALIAPYIDVRNEMRLMCNNFFEIYVSTPIETCMNRDPKGLYAKVKNGEIENFTGITAPYNKPINPEMKIDTTNISIEATSSKLFNFIESKLLNN